MGHCPLDGSPGQVWCLDGLWHENPHLLTPSFYMTLAVPSTHGSCQTENLQRLVIEHGLLLFSCQLLISKCDAICVGSYPDVCHSLISWGCLWQRFKRSRALCPSAKREPFRMLTGAGAAKLYYICLGCVPFQPVEEP